MHDVTTPSAGDLVARIEENDYFIGPELVVYEGRCSGACCERFPLPFTHARAAELASEIAAGTWPSSEPRYRDREVVFPMLVPLAGDRALRDGWAWYTCKHHDKASGDCTIYAQRPEMCRRYPYGRACENPDSCTLKITRTRLYPHPRLSALGALVKAGRE